MKSPDSPDPDQMEFLRYGGHSALTGAALLLLGIGLIALALVPSASTRKAIRSKNIKVILFGIAAVVGGAAIGRSPSRVIIDRTRRTVRKEWNLLVAVPFRTTLVKDEAPVTLSKHEVFTGHGTHTRFRVRLPTRHGEVVLVSLDEHKAARDKAVVVARFLGAMFRDATGSAPVDLRADEIGVPLRERASGRAGEREFPSQPEDSRIGYEVEGDEVVFDIPSRGYRWTHRLALAVAVFVGGGLLAGIGVILSRSPSGGPSPSDLVLSVFTLALALGVAGVGTWLIPGTTRIRERVIASPRRLRLERRHLLLRTEIELAAGAIEDLRTGRSELAPARTMLRPGWAVHARAGEQSLEFGVGCSSEEVDWLREMVHALVTAPVDEGGDPPDRKDV
ncbi:MAG: hypothetical protein HYY93_08235 [Planctomycetes bacterium]|nr:hypothetical protein [Planctomycetota bacterium]